LDLCATTPPITEVIDGIARQFARHTILLVTQVYEKVSAFSLAQLQERLDWTDLRVYDLDEKGRNHGILLGTKARCPVNLCSAGSGKRWLRDHLTATSALPTTH